MHRCVPILLVQLLAVSIYSAEFRFGAAAVDITPDYPIRLSGFAVRKSESEGVRQHLFTKALAISQNTDKPAVILTIDNCGISREIWGEITSRIQQQFSIPPERVVIFSSHTHSAPMLSNQIPHMFIAPLPENQQAQVNRYTSELIDKVVRAAGAALRDTQPGRLFFGQGRVGFAKNRRTEGGPVDHDAPMLVVRNSEGKVRSVLVNYACHCTTLVGDSNFVHGDWAGVAQAAIERNNPGATALVSIGCGADSNPLPRGKMEHVERYGEELAREVQSVLQTPLAEISGILRTRAKFLELPFEPLPSREEWVKRAGEAGIVGYHAKINLERLDRGERLPTALPYQVQTWNFGEQLAMVFLPGEVVVDYALRLKTEFSPAWVSSYANWVPCYIPSKRVLKEGGYEAESSLWYYDRPTRLSANTEELIVAAVHELLPRTFEAQKRQ
jgi:hypothetical protein